MNQTIQMREIEDIENFMRACQMIHVCIECRALVKERDVIADECRCPHCDYQGLPTTLMIPRGSVYIWAERASVTGG